MQFTDEKEKERFGRAQLGEDVRTFLMSNTGRYLQGRAAADLEQVKEDLLQCNPWTPWGRRKIQALQQKAALARTFMQYCVDAIQDGEIAYQELKDEE